MNRFSTGLQLIICKKGSLSPAARRELRPHAPGPAVLRICRFCNTVNAMKTLTVRLPQSLIADIEAESRGRKISKSDVVRERIERAPRQRRRTASLDGITDLIGSVDGLPADLSSRKKEYLRASGYRQKRPR